MSFLHGWSKELDRTTLYFNLGFAVKTDYRDHPKEKEKKEKSQRVGGKGVKLHELLFVLPDLMMIPLVT